MTGKLTLLLGTLLATGAITAAVLTAGSGPASSTPKRSPAVAVPADRSHARPAQMRTLVVSTGAMPAPSAPGRVMNALLKSGSVPRHPMVGTVMTDTDCGPDTTGMSRCRNVIKMPGGHMMVVRHPHRMMDVPCMTPGEKIHVRAAV